MNTYTEGSVCKAELFISLILYNIHACNREVHHTLTYL